jgi:hypothetical protein
MRSGAAGRRLMVDGIGHYGKHVTLPGRTSPKLVSYGHVNPFLPSGNRGTKIFFGIIGIKSVKIDDLRSIRL